MARSEDHIALAAEYALGTLDGDERAQAEAMMLADEDFAALVEAWEYRLGVLNQMVGLVEPRPELWDNIKAAIRQAEPQAPVVLAETAPPAPAEQPAEPGEPVTPAIDLSIGDHSVDDHFDVDRSIGEHLIGDQSAVAQAAADHATANQAISGDSNVVRLAGQARRWRSVATALTAIAAALIAMLGLQIYVPDLLPDALRPSVRTKVVEVKAKAPAAAPDAQYVALLQGQGGGPAFILTVDGATKEFTVRKVGTTAAEPGKSYELWLISDKLPRPRSLGVIGSGDFTTRKVLASYDANVIDNATYAVTIEQAGGSPDGAPHSPPVFSGKLIETVPPGAAAAQPPKK